MKKINKTVVLVLLICFSVEMQAQDTSTFYYDKDWKECEEGDHKYYGLLFENEDHSWTKLDYYADGQEQMIGSFKTEAAETKEGLFIYFANNGDTTGIYGYVNNEREGVFVRFYDNGVAEVRTILKDGEQDGPTVYFHPNGNLSSEGMFKAGSKVGEWKYYDNYGDYISSEHHLQEYTTTCGYNIKLPNDRWIYIKNDDKGRIVRNTSLDQFYRRSVKDSKGNELYYNMYTACLHNVSSHRQTAAKVGDALLSNMGVKHKVVTSYGDIEFDFDGTIYSYSKKEDGRKLNCLLFVVKEGSNVMELIFEFQKGVESEQIAEIKSIVEAISWP
ncbi:MAG: hypothetical protein JXR19_09465 [Bacteroidia bacterium]